MKTDQKVIINQIVKKFSNLNGTSFVGIREYTSKTTGETANHVVNANFSYCNAVEKDLKALQSITDKDIQAIAEKGFSTEMVKMAVEKLVESFTKNQNPETQSNQSKAQQNAFVNITKSIKLCIETGQIHIYALGVSKQVLKEGEYKKVNSRELTLCQNAIKKYLNFTTAKYRNFIVNPECLANVKIQGETFVLSE